MPRIIIDLTKKAYECCCNFEFCATNACPLHEDFHKTLFDMKEDKLLKGWKKCRATKKSRTKIANSFKLKSMGLRLGELRGIRQSIKYHQRTLTTHQKAIEFLNKAIPQPPVTP